MVGMRGATVTAEIAQEVERRVLAIAHDRRFRSDFRYDDHPEYAGLLELLRGDEEAIEALVSMLGLEDAGWVPTVALSKLFPDAIAVPDDEVGRYDCLAARWRAWWEENHGVRP